MNIRAAAVMGVVGAGGLGQRIHVAISLFHEHRLTTLLAIYLIVTLVDAAKSAQGRGVLASRCPRLKEGAIGVAASRLCPSRWRLLPVARRANTRPYAPTTRK